MSDDGDGSPTSVLKERKEGNLGLLYQSVQSLGEFILSLAGFDF